MQTDDKTTWWIWRPVQQRLVKWTLALLQGRRYTVRLQPAGTGSHDPETRIIQANPQWFADEPAPVQFRVTQGVLAHEVGHALFTGSWPEQEENLLCQLVNMLEDERIERAICVYYPGIVPAIRLVGDLAYGHSKAFVAAPPAEQALACCLAWRWAHGRTGEAEMFDRLGVSGDGRALWAAVRPLVERAWAAPDTGGVIEQARQILGLLGLPESRPQIDLPDWLPLMPHSSGIPRKRDGRALPIPERPANDSPGLGREPGSCHAPNADEFTKPAPYVDLEEEARPLARRLAEALKEPRPDSRALPHEWRGRYSFRQETRTPDMPHLAPQGVGRARRSLALAVLVDRSGSMDTLAGPVKLAVMAVYLAATAVGIPVGISFFGHDEDRPECMEPFELAPLSQQPCEEAKALIAGFSGETDNEFLAWALAKAGRDLSARPERLRVVLVVHDGEPVYAGRHGDDWECSLAELERLERRGIVPIGVYLGSYQPSIAKLQGLFKRLVVTGAEGLPERLGGLLLGLG